MPAVKNRFTPAKIQTSDTANVRAARALEYIAAALDRIDINLERLVALARNEKR